MDFANFLQAISNVGFPIAACCFMFWQNSKLSDSIASLNVTLNKIDLRLEALESKERD